MGIGELAAKLVEAAHSAVHKRGQPGMSTKAIHRRAQHSDEWSVGDEEERWYWCECECGCGGGCSLEVGCMEGCRSGGTV